MIDTVEERETEDAARWHSRTNGLGRPASDVLAYKHAGFSNAFIARQLETTENTVEKRLKRVIAVYGPEAAIVQPDGPIHREDFNPVTAEEIADWPEHYQQWWLESGREHYEAVPRDIQDRFPNHPK